jgi:hypothetical protein
MERQYAGLDVSEVKRIKDLKHENSRLKRKYCGPVAWRMLRSSWDDDLAGQLKAVPDYVCKLQRTAKLIL